MTGVSTGNPHPPRWFYALVAAALLALAGAAWWSALTGRYALSASGTAVLDTRTGELCGNSAAGLRCVHLVPKR